MTKENQRKERHFKYELTDSTNKRARLFVDGIPDDETAGITYDPEMDYLFTAEAQSTGRGRLGRSFLSDKGRGLYLSYLFKPKLCAKDSIHLTTYAALAIHDVILEDFGLDTQIKWVNDIYCQGKKLAGILTEGRISCEGDLEYAVIGIGINLKNLPFPEELRNIATSIEEVTGISPDGDVIAQHVQNRLKAFDPHKRTEYMNRYRSLCLTLGKEVVLVSEKESYTAFAEDIDEDGRLTVVLKNGERKKIDFGDVSIKPTL